ncbi:unnamed protein product [Rotaria sordida]|uniref:Uncharacterized protein n=1 Tax=Rotaria sordida TaxID=392033 RepID=A0A819S6F0_9BILA|nr:unnamed protein product [Rotaria sordida]CAF1490390.1 unnamed protein product [Rotaria sordida]CAF4032344.1 unnamed protein product [Rotaria sordida]CAF4064893.1 unnamed protein product [Rotaria sordida]
MLIECLILQLNGSIHYERLMISKLKQACDFKYTLIFEQIIQDIGFNKIFIDKYQSYCEKENVFSFGINNLN